MHAFFLAHFTSGIAKAWPESTLPHTLPHLEGVSKGFLEVLKGTSSFGQKPEVPFCDPQELAGGLLGV